MATKKTSMKKPQPKRLLGPEDSGLAQRVGGLKAAGNFFSGADQKAAGKKLADAYGSSRIKKFKNDQVSKPSRGGSTKKK